MNSVAGFNCSYYYIFIGFPLDSVRACVEYFTELSSGPGADYFRPNAWPNTPDILHEQLQAGDAPTYMARLGLAATLAGSYGIYGPAYELLEHKPRHAGSDGRRGVKACSSLLSFSIPPLPSFSLSSLPSPSASPSTTASVHCPIIVCRSGAGGSDVRWASRAP